MVNETTFTLNRATAEGGLDEHAMASTHFTERSELIGTAELLERAMKALERDAQMFKRDVQVVDRDLVSKLDSPVLQSNALTPWSDAHVIERDFASKHDSQALKVNAIVPEHDAQVLERDVLEHGAQVLERDEVLDCDPQTLDLMEQVQRDAQVCALVAQIRVLHLQNKMLEERGKRLAQELDIFRHRRLVYWSDRFRNRFDAWHLMHPSFEQAKDDSMLFQGDMTGFRLLPSSNLVRLSSLKYELDLGRAGLRAILLAPIIDMPSKVGELCMRITDSTQIVLEEVSIPLAKITEEEPCEFKFSSLEGTSRNRLYVHIFARGVDVPIRIFELRKYPKFGFAKLQRKLFAGFRFND